MEKCEKSGFIFDMKLNQNNVKYLFLILISASNKIIPLDLTDSMKQYKKHVLNSGSTKIFPL